MFVLSFDDSFTTNLASLVDIWLCSTSYYGISSVTVHEYDNIEWFSYRFDLLQAVDIALYVPLIVSTKVICGTMWCIWNPKWK